MASLKMIKHVPIQGTILCLTGLRIGGTKDDIEIGGMDNPIIRHPQTRLPYIPGSSLKGKMRSSLEYAYDRVGQRGQPCGCGQSNCLVCRIFGPHKNVRHDLGPTRILVRDAMMDVESGEDPERWIEIKSENWIDRTTGIAGNGGLRQNERVVSGAKFKFDISLRIFADDDETKLVNTVREALTLIEQDYLGASGSRGYGRVKFLFDTPTAWRE